MKYKEAKKILMQKMDIRCIKDMLKSIIGVPEVEERERIEQNSIWDMSLEVFLKFPNAKINPQIQNVRCTPNRNNNSSKK